MSDKLTTQPWHLATFEDTYLTPPTLYEVRVKDWSTGLVGDYRGCVVAYIPGGYSDDADTAAVAAANAELIASAPTLKADVERLTAENAALAALLLLVMQCTGCRIAHEPGAAVEFYDRETLKLKYLTGDITPVKVVTVTTFDEPAPPKRWGYFMRDWGIGVDSTPVLLSQWDTQEDALADMRSRLGEYRVSGRRVEQVPPDEANVFIMYSDRYPATMHYVTPIERV